MSEIVEFLTARLDEDERDAIAIRDCEAFHGVESDAEAEVLRLSDPHRVLREVEAKRQLLAMFPDSADGDGWNEAGSQVLEVLAAAYDTHPDYRDDTRR